LADRIFDTNYGTLIGAAGADPTIEAVIISQVTPVLEVLGLDEYRQVHP
jgi:hypothetical protein